MKRFLKLVCEAMIFLGLAALALVLVFPAQSSVPIWIPMVGMDALLFGIAVKDLQEERIPNLVTYPIMLAGVVCAYILQDATFLLFWFVLWLAWETHLMGAGDAKLLMGLFALWPDMQLAYVVAASILITGIPYLIYKYRGQWRLALRGLGWRLFTLKLLPSPAEFQNEAVPYAFSFCLAGGIYLWLRLGMV